MSGLADLRVSRTTADVLRQHRDALETLRTAFNALEAKQRQQAETLIELAHLSRDHRSLLNGVLMRDAAFRGRSLWQRIRWICTGS